MTPYGTNSFAHIVNIVGGEGNFGGHDLVSRGITITEPTGAKQLYLYRFDSPLIASTYTNVPASTPLGTLDDGTGGTNVFQAVSFRNSFYWNSRQYEALSTETITSFTAADYFKGRMQHWLQDTNDLYVSATLSISRDPSPSSDGSIEGQKTFYDYPGKIFSCRVGSETLPAVIAQQLPNGETSYIWKRYNSFGFVTNEVSTYTKTDGTVGTRTNRYEFADNITTNIGIQNGAAYLTNTFTVPNLLTKAIDANNDVIAQYAGYDIVAQTNIYIDNVVWGTNQIELYSTRVLPRFQTNNPLGVTQYTYNSRNRLNSWQTPAGLTTTNIFVASGTFSNWLQQTIALEISRTNSFGYTTNGLVGAFTNELGLSISASWDPLLRLTGIGFPDGSSISNRYDKLDLAAVKDRMNNWTFAGYDRLRHLIATTNANSAVTRLGWCGCGSLETITNALNQVTTFYHDNQLRRTGILFPDNSSLSYQYDLAGRVTNVLDGASRSFKIAYDNQSQPLSINNAFGQVWQTVYDIKDHLVQITDANNVTVTNTFDLLDRLLARAYPDGGVEKIGYTFGFWSATSYTNQLGSNVVNLIYDPAERLTNVIYPTIATNRFAYNPAGDLLTLIDGKNQTTTWNRDVFGDVTNKLDAANNEILRLAFDLNDRVTNRWTPAKGTTIFRRDPVGNVTNVDYSAATTPTPSISYAFDLLNQITNMIDGIGTTRFTWTTANQLSSEDGPWSDDTVSLGYTDRQRTSLSLLQPSASAWAQNYFYDAARRFTNTTSSAGAFTYFLGGASSASPLIKKLSLPNSSYITNNYDPVARLLGTVLKNSSSLTLNLHSYAYDLANQRTQQTFKDGNYEDYTHDLLGQLTSAKGKESGGALRLNEQLAYAYDPAGNLNFRTNNALVQNFSVNNLNELATATRNGTLTVAGNTTTVATNVTVNASNAVLYSDNTFAGTNQTLADGNNTFTVIGVNASGLRATTAITVNLPATNAFAYDLNGNLRTNGSRVYDYDAENQLSTNWVAGLWKTEFTYDGLNRRRIVRDYGWQSGAWVKTNETRYVYDVWLPIQERNSNNVVQVTYTRGRDLSGTRQGAGGIGGLLARTDANGSAFYHADGGGNITALINANQLIVAKYVYDPFGNPVSKNGPLADANAMRFSSMLQHQSSGLTFFLYRGYDPMLQRFLNSDPIHEFGGINLYRYAGNDPMRFIDPYGLGFGDWMSGFAEGWGDAAESIGNSIGGSLNWSYDALTGNWSALNADADYIADTEDLSDASYGALAGLDPTGFLLIDSDNPNMMGAGTFGMIMGMLDGAGELKAARQLCKKVATKLKPISGAKGAHTVFKRNKAGKITKYETYKPQTNPRNPNPWQSEKRFDRSGDPHFNKSTKQDVPTPHVHDPTTPGGVRPAQPGEIPR